MRPKTWNIYALTDPLADNAIRYVGWSYNVKRRHRAHINGARRTVSHKSHWIRSLLFKNAEPGVIVLESGIDDWQEAERRWISHYRLLGAKLTNATDGGEGTPGLLPNQETRRKMSAAQKGRKQSPESTAKTRAALLGRKQSPEHVAKLAATRKGKAPIAATIAAAEASRGRQQSAAHIEKRISPLRGRIRPELRKFSDEDVRMIRSSELSLRKIAKILEVGQTTIHAIRHQRAYRDVPDS